MGAVDLPKALTGRLHEQAAMLAARMRQGRLAASVAIGLEVLDELLEAEAAQLAGPKGKHDPQRTYKRRGAVDGVVTLGGRHVTVSRPGCALPTTPAKLVAATTERRAELNTRPLDQQRWLIILIDGFSFGQHLLGRCARRHRRWHKDSARGGRGHHRERHLVHPADRQPARPWPGRLQGLPFALDGSKALSKAIRAVWGGKALIGRCRLHREREVLDHLREAEHDRVRRKLRVAWQLTDADAAKRDLEELARALARKHPRVPPAPCGRGSTRP